MKTWLWGLSVSSLMILYVHKPQMFDFFIGYKNKKLTTLSEIWICFYALVGLRETRGNEKNFICLSLRDAVAIVVFWKVQREVDQSTLLFLSKFRSDFCFCFVLCHFFRLCFWSFTNHPMMVTWLSLTFLAFPVSSATIHSI